MSSYGSLNYYIGPHVLIIMDDTRRTHLRTRNASSSKRKLELHNVASNRFILHALKTRACTPSTGSLRYQRD